MGNVYISLAKWKKNQEEFVVKKKIEKVLWHHFFVCVSIISSFASFRIHVSHKRALSKGAVYKKESGGKRTLGLLKLKEKKVA